MKKRSLKLQAHYVVRLEKRLEKLDDKIRRISARIPWGERRSIIRRLTWAKSILHKMAAVTFAALLAHSHGQLVLPLVVQ